MTAALRGQRLLGGVYPRNPRPEPTIVDVVHARAGDSGGYSFDNRSADGPEIVPLTFERLDENARRVAGWLSSKGVAAGERVLLTVPDGPDFLGAFLGCLYAGAIAVPVPVPDRYRVHTDRAAGVFRDAAVSAVVTDQANLAAVREWVSGQHRPRVSCGAVEEAAGFSTDWRRPVIGGDTVAFLQYTSGSTGDPRGVVVSHGNLMDNLTSQWRCLRDRFAGTAQRVVSWLPMTHDMGLVSALFTAYNGGAHLLMTPDGFLRRPLRWLTLIDEFDANATVAPTFAYDHCAARVTDDQVAGLDLSRWTTALVGAEPVRAATLAKFSERFAAAGFRPSAFVPCYGLAEATLLVTAGTALAEGPTIVRADADALAGGTLTVAEAGRPVTELVSSGPAQGCQVHIVDPDTGAPLDGGRVGEIWVRGRSVAQGYWGDPGRTAASFNTMTAAGEAGFLRTGDLGAIRDGELVVTGRRKDMLIVHGRNLYPQDLETAAAAAAPDNHAGATAVFAIDDSHVVVVQEIRPSVMRYGAGEQIAVTIQATLVRQFGIRPPCVVLVRPGAVAKTTSGKVRRSLTRQLFLDAALDLLYHHPADSQCCGEATRTLPAGEER